MSLRQNTLTRVGVVRQYPIDLAVVSLAAVFAYVVITSLEAGSPLRLMTTIPLMLFLPGYALVSVLFPAAERDSRNAPSPPLEQRPRGIDTIERLGLAIALSLAMVPLLVLLLPVTEWGLQATPTAAGLLVITVGFAQLGAVRRLRTPQSKRFTVAPLTTLQRLRSGRSFRASSLVLLVAIGLAVGALALAVLVPASAGGYTEMGLYSETDDGELVAGELPGEIAPGESISATVSIENQEGAEKDYTVVVQQQRFEDDEIVDRSALGEVDASISDGETGTGEQAITPTAEAGETVRISVLLYDGEPPAEPTNENAIEDTFFWVTVTTE